MNIEELKSKLTEIDAMAKDGTIQSDRAQLWKDRLIAEFEHTGIPAERSRELPNTLAYLPGRMVGGAIEILKSVARGSGATYEGLSKQEGYMNKDGTQNRKPGKSVVELYNDLEKRL